MSGKKVLQNFVITDLRRMPFGKIFHCLEIAVAKPLRPVDPRRAGLCFADGNEQRVVFEPVGLAFAEIAEGFIRLKAFTDAVENFYARLDHRGKIDFVRIELRKAADMPFHEQPLPDQLVKTDQQRIAGKGRAG